MFCHDVIHLFNQPRFSKRQMCRALHKVFDRKILIFIHLRHLPTGTDMFIESRGDIAMIISQRLIEAKYIQKIVICDVEKIPPDTDPFCTDWLDGVLRRNPRFFRRPKLYGPEGSKLQKG
jgi:hypothetical protein